MKGHAAWVCVFVAVSSICAPTTTSAAGPGKIIVAGDENWTAINDATTLTLASNIAQALAPGGGKKFLYHIENSLPWLKGASFLAGLTGAGNTITYDSGPPDAFQQNPFDYDAVFVARQYANDRVVPTAQLLGDVQAGGNVSCRWGVR
jgi:hypothetical protein